MEESKLHRLLHCTADEIHEELPILLHVNEVAPSQEQKEKNAHEENRLSGLQHLKVNDGIYSYDQVYIHEDLRKIIKVVRNVLLKVEEVELVERAVLDDAEGKDFREESKRFVALLVTQAEVLVHPRKIISPHGGGWAEVCRYEPPLPDMSKYLLWRIEDPTKSFSDFRIIIESQDDNESLGQHHVERKSTIQETYHVHKAFLAFGTFVDSKYFAHLFRDGGQLAEGVKNQLTLQLSRAQARAFPVLLNYFYSGELLPADYKYEGQGDTEIEYGEDDISMIMDKKHDNTACNYTKRDVEMLVDDNCQSLALLADYFQIPSLMKLVTDRIHDNMKNINQLQCYLPCLIASRHINEMKHVYRRAVFLLVQQFLGMPSWSASEILASIDVEFLVNALQLCHRLTRIHNCLLGEHLVYNKSGDLYGETEEYKRCFYITSTIVSEYLAVHDNCISPENLLALTNEDHMPQVSPDVAQHLLDVMKATITSSCNEIEFLSLKKRCLSALEDHSEIMINKDAPSLPRFCIRVLTVDSGKDLARGIYRLCQQKSKTGGSSFEDWYYTNSQGCLKECHDLSEGVVRDFQRKIFQLSLKDCGWYLHIRNDDRKGATLISSISSYNIINSGSIYQKMYPVFPPPIGWTFNTEPFFLEYVLEDDAGDDLPLAA